MWRWRNRFSPPTPHYYKVFMWSFDLWFVYYRGQKHMIKFQHGWDILIYSDWVTEEKRIMLLIMPRLFPGFQFVMQQGSPRTLIRPTNLASKPNLGNLGENRNIKIKLKTVAFSISFSVPYRSVGSIVEPSLLKIYTTNVLLSNFHTFITKEVCLCFWKNRK